MDISFMKASEYGPSDKRKEINDLGCRFKIDKMLLRQPQFHEMLARQIAEKEKELIYKAVKQGEPDHWICVRPSKKEGPTIDGMGWEYYLTIECREVQVAQVYVPVFTGSAIPTETYFCKWCGGFTKNDMRGHCRGCGGPRGDLE